jgi:hypothetical protein
MKEGGTPAATRYPSTIGERAMPITPFLNGERFDEGA